MRFTVIWVSLQIRWCALLASISSTNNNKYDVKTTFTHVCINIKNPSNEQFQYTDNITTQSVIHHKYSVIWNKRNINEQNRYQLQRHKWNMRSYARSSRGCGDPPPDGRCTSRGYCPATCTTWPRASRAQSWDLHCARRPRSGGCHLDGSGSEGHVHQHRVRHDGKSAVHEEMNQELAVSLLTLPFTLYVEDMTCRTHRWRTSCDRAHLVELAESLSDSGEQISVHGEGLAGPVHRSRANR